MLLILPGIIYEGLFSTDDASAAGKKNTDRRLGGA
jgi:hypothetical protein